MRNGRPIDALTPAERRAARLRRRDHLRRRRRRLGRRAYIRSVHTLPSLATLGNAVSGFAAVYVAQLNPATVGGDPWARFLADHSLSAACYLVALAMFFDAIDGRLARFARQTSDFGAQLDSLADVISFGVAPAFIALQAFRTADGLGGVPLAVGRLAWAAGALYLACAAVRLARFNVSNEHGEQHHFSFLGLPTPGAGAAVVSLVLLQQYLQYSAGEFGGTAAAVAAGLATACALLLPAGVAACGLLMVSAWRYPHVVNRYLRGRRSFARLILAVVLLLLLVVAHQVTLAAAGVGYALWGFAGGLWAKYRTRA